MLEIQFARVAFLHQAFLGDGLFFLGIRLNQYFYYVTNTACRFLQQVYCVTSYVVFCVFVHVPQCSAFVTSFFYWLQIAFWHRNLHWLSQPLCYDKSQNVTQYLSLYKTRIST